MKAAVLRIALAILTACGAAPSEGVQGRASNTRDTSWRDPTINRTDSVTPSREADRPRNFEKTDKPGRGR